MYHNRKFKEEAEKRGLIIDRDPLYGWTLTSPGQRLLDWLQTVQLSDIQLHRTIPQYAVAGSMTSSDLAALRDSYRPGSTGHKAVSIAEHTGCRASEIVRLTGNSIAIHGSSSASVYVKNGKGGRDREIKISDPASVRALADIKASVVDGERIVPCKAGSIQKSINRHMKALGGSAGGSMKSEYASTGFHAIRKNFAQREFDRARQSGCSRQESLDRVSAQLGHGAGRDLATLQRYVENIY